MLQDAASLISTQPNGSFPSTERHGLLSSGSSNGLIGGISHPLIQRTCYRGKDKPGWRCWFVEAQNFAPQQITIFMLNKIQKPKLQILKIRAVLQDCVASNRDHASNAVGLLGLPSRPIRKLPTGSLRRTASIWCPSQALDQSAPPSKLENIGIILYRPRDEDLRISLCSEKIKQNIQARGQWLPECQNLWQLKSVWTDFGDDLYGRRHVFKYSSLTSNRIKQLDKFISQKAKRPFVLQIR